MNGSLGRALLASILMLGVWLGCGQPKAQPVPAAVEAPKGTRHTVTSFEEDPVIGSLEPEEEPRKRMEEARSQMDRQRRQMEERDGRMARASRPKSMAMPALSPDARDPVGSLKAARTSSGSGSSGMSSQPPPPPLTTSSARLPANPVDDLVHRLASANAAFNTPESMSLDEAQTIQLLLSPVHSEEALAGMVRGPGKKVTVTVKYNHRMRATLQVDPKDPDANAFQIEALSQAEQAVSGEDITSWTWKVTPRTPGTHYLTLELSVVLELGQSSVPRTIMQINRTIEIRVPPRSRPVWIPVIAALAAAGLLGAGFVLWRRGRRKGAVAQIRSSADPHLFISYARRDEQRVIPVVNGLQGLGYQVWMDQTGIDGATLWSQEIVENIRCAKVVLVFASRASFGSDFVVREILLASEERKPILPLYLDQVEMPSSIRLQLAGIQHLLLHPGRLEEDLNAIHRALQRLGVAIS